MNNVSASAVGPVDQQRLFQKAITQIERLCALLEQGVVKSQMAGGSTDIATAGPLPNPDRAAGVTLGQFLATVQDLNPAEREQVVEAAMAMLEQTYVHLPLKRALYAIDPLRRLKLLQQKVNEISPRRFHAEMIAVFHSLHDLHTSYILPIPYQGKTAFLPFL